MKFQEFQTLSKRTLNPATTVESDNYLLGLYGEGGEIVDLVKKLEYHGHALSDKNKHGKTYRELLSEEIGDCSWYIAAEATMLNIDLGDLLASMKKLLSDDVPPSKLCRTYMKTVVKIDRQKDEFLLYSSDPESDETTAKGGLMIYLAKLVRILKRLCLIYELDYAQIIEDNVTKLIKRYPEKYSDQESVNRAV